MPRPRPQFGHGSGGGRWSYRLIGSFHPSQRNTFHWSAHAFHARRGSSPCWRTGARLTAAASAAARPRERAGRVREIRLRAPVVLLRPNRDRSLSQMTRARIPPRRSRGPNWRWSVARWSRPLRKVEAQPRQGGTNRCACCWHMTVRLARWRQWRSPRRSLGRATRCYESSTYRTDRDFGLGPVGSRHGPYAQLDAAITTTPRKR